MRPVLTKRLVLEFALLVWCCVNFHAYFAGQSAATFDFPLSMWRWLGGRGRLVIGLVLVIDCAAAVALVALSRGRSVRGRRESDGQPRPQH